MTPELKDMIFDALLFYSLGMNTLVLIVMGVCEYRRRKALQ